MMRPFRCAALLCVLSYAPAAAFSQESESDPAVDAVRQTGAQVLELAQNDPRLDVAYHLNSLELTPERLKPLEGVQDRLVHLNLRGTNLNDEMAASLAPLTELVRLHLERTAISDAGLAHLAGMTKLEYLNLYGTDVTDAGLEHLGGLTNLKKLFVWETNVTLDGVRTLRAKLPELQIIGGPEEPKSVEPKEPVVAPKPAS